METRIGDLKTHKSQSAMRAKLPTTLIPTLRPPHLNHLPSRTLLSLPHRPNAPKPPSSTTTTTTTRTLTSTTPLRKKGGKQDSKRTVPLNASKAQSNSPSSSSSSPSGAVDAFDFSDYSAAIKRAHEHLGSELAKIKAGGRSAEEIEGVRVVLGGKTVDGAADRDGKGKGKRDRAGGGKERAPSVKLGDVANLVARGRNVGVLVGEKDVRSPFPFPFLILPSLLVISTTPHPPILPSCKLPPLKILSA